MKYEDWFGDARDAEDVITAMWNTFPEMQNKTTNVIQEDAKMKGYIDYSMALRKRAEVNFENFLLARSHVAHDMLELSIAWRSHVKSSIGSSVSVAGSAASAEDNNICTPNLDGERWRETTHAKKSDSLSTQPCGQWLTRSHDRITPAPLRCPRITEGDG